MDLEPKSWRETFWIGSILNQLILVIVTNDSRTARCTTGSLLWLWHSEQVWSIFQRTGRGNVSLGGHAISLRQYGLGSSKTFFMRYASQGTVASTDCMLSGFNIASYMTARVYGIVTKSLILGNGNFWTNSGGPSICGSIRTTIWQSIW